MHNHNHNHSKALGWAFGLTAGFMAVEFAGGLWCGSLALVSDAVHMLADAAALGLGLFAAHVAGRKASPEKTFGWRRVEVLAALANGAALWLVAGLILREAVSRLSGGSGPVNAPAMIAIAAAGLLVNVFCAVILRHAAEENINARGAFLHVLSDMAGSIAAIAAAGIIILTGWRKADAVASLAISGLIVYGAWQLVRDSLHILMEGAPERINRSELLAALSSVEGVCGIHELHVWTLSTGFEALSAHVLINDFSRAEIILNRAQRVLAEKFSITHAALQLETAESEFASCKNGCCY